MKIQLVWIVSLCGALALAGCSSETPESETTADTSAEKNQQPVGRSEDLPVPEITTRPLDVHTTAAGFVVFVNGQPARTNSGELLLTPCRVQIPKNFEGDIQITVAKEGVQDSMQLVLGSEQSELIFAQPEPANELTESLLSAALLNTDVGRPVALLSLNTSRPELDPYVEPSGLVMWFVGDRTEGRAIYSAERKSPFDFFNPPQILRATQSGELPATPSVTTEGKLVYAVPERQRILSVLVQDEAFGRPELLQQGTRSNVLWESAEISPDGLHLYWTERPQGSQDRYGRAAHRDSTAAVFKDADEFNLPGVFPCFSADGLRQYLFDGKTLKRARRQSQMERFASPEVLTTLNLPNYAANSNRRSFWVSDDEEWLYYTAHLASGDLYAVRLFYGPHWGYAPRGESIPPRQTVAEVKPVDPATEPFIPMPPPEKPMETAPPYPKFREEFVAHLKNREYAKAEQLLAEAVKNPRFENDQTVLEWDRTEWQHITGFWKTIREHFKSMQPGTEFRIRTAKVKFVKFADDVIHYRLSKEGTKPLDEMQPRDLLALLRPGLKDEDPETHMQIATLFYYDKDGSKELAETHFAAAGRTGGLFLERLPGRILHNAQRQMGEDNIAEALSLLENLLDTYPESPAAVLAKKLQADAYSKIAWEATGPRDWEQPEPGTYIAAKSRQPGSYLVSPEMYTHFELRSEWKITEPGGSGGVFFRFAAPGRDDPYRKAFKLQLADDQNFKPDPQSTGALHTYEAPSENASKPRGEWNTLRLRVQNLKVEVWINDKQVLDTIAQNDLVPLEGFVALDGVNGGIAYRKTLLVELKPTIE